MALPATPNKARSIRRYPVASGGTYVDGAPVLLVAGEITEAGADPVLILGFAAHDAVLTELDPDPGYGLVFVAEPNSTFMMSADAALLEAEVGIAYDMNVDANGVALLDTASVAAARLTLEAIYIEPTGVNLAEVSVLAANRQAMG